MGGVLSAGGVDVYEFSADLESRDSLPIDENLEVNSIEDMLRIFCQDLASHDEEDRQTMLTFLEGAIREFDKVNGIHEPCILLAFYYAYIQREEDVYEAAIFIDSFLQYMDAVPQGQVDIELVNDQIVHWMSILVDHKICLSEKISSHLIPWLRSFWKKLTVRQSGILSVLFSMKTVLNGLHSLRIVYSSGPASIT